MRLQFSEIFLDGAFEGSDKENKRAIGCQKALPRNDWELDVWGGLRVSRIEAKLFADSGNLSGGWLACFFGGQLFGATLGAPWVLSPAGHLFLGRSTLWSSGIGNERRVRFGACWQVLQVHAVGSRIGGALRPHHLFWQPSHVGSRFRRIQTSHLHTYAVCFG